MCGSPMASKQVGFCEMPLYTPNGLQEIPYYSRGSGFLGSFWDIILVNFGLLQLIEDLLDPKNRFWMA